MLFIVTNGSYSDYAWQFVADTTEEELNRVKKIYEDKLQLWRTHSNAVDKKYFSDGYRSLHGKESEDYMEESNQVKYPDLGELFKSELQGKIIEVEEFWVGH